MGRVQASVARCWKWLHLAPRAPASTFQFTRHPQAAGTATAARWRLTGRARRVLRPRLGAALALQRQAQPTPQRLHRAMVVSLLLCEAAPLAAALLRRDPAPPGALPRAERRHRLQRRGRRAGLLLRPQAVEGLLEAVGHVHGRQAARGQGQL